VESPTAARDAKETDRLEVCEHRTNLWTSQRISSAVCTFLKGSKHIYLQCSVFFWEQQEISSVLKYRLQWERLFVRALMELYCVL
jgi:uncharacterized membrane protein YczE